MAFRYVYNYGIADAVPLNGSIPYSELAAKTGVDQVQLKQMLRQIMATRVFCEPQHGHVAHTATSKLLTEDGIKNWNGWVAEDLFPMSGSHIEALNKWGHGNPEPTQAVLQAAYNTDLPFFAYYETAPARKERFARVLQTSAKDPHHHVQHLITGYDWAALGPVTVVDVGGNTGHASVAIAESAPEIQCVVQDLPALIAAAQDPRYSCIPPHLRDRVRLMAHNFFDPQPAEVVADVYFIRNVLHNWSTPYCRKILTNLVSGLRAGKRIIIQDEIMPPVASVPAPQERIMRSMDAAMGVFMNAQARDMDEWVRLIESVDPGLQIVRVIHPPGAATSIIETVLQHQHSTGPSAPSVEKKKSSSVEAPVVPLLPREDPPPPPRRNTVLVTTNHERSPAVGEELETKSDTVEGTDTTSPPLDPLPLTEPSGGEEETAQEGKNVSNKQPRVED